MIDQIRKIEREVDSDLFSLVVHHIIDQQISIKAQTTIWQIMQENLGAEYITDFAVRVRNGDFDLTGIWYK